MAIYNAHAREFRAVLSAAGRDDVRSYLNGFFIDVEASRIVATNGHVMISAPVDISAGHNPPDAGIIYKVPKPSIPAGADFVTVDTDRDVVTSTVVNSRRSVVREHPVERIKEGRFPDWQRIMVDRRENPGSHGFLAIDPRLIEPASKVLDAPAFIWLGDDDRQPVTVRFSGHPEMHCTVMPSPH